MIAPHFVFFNGRIDQWTGRRLVCILIEMFGRCAMVIMLLMSGVAAFGVAKGNAKRELQGLVRTPRVEFPVPLEFHRRFGFVAFAQEGAATSEVTRVLKEAKGRTEDAALYLQAARVHDAQGDAGGALRQYSRAMDLFRKRLEVSPDEVRALVGLGEALTALGRFAEAQSVLERAGDAASVELWLARARLNAERSWFTAVGEAQRFSTASFLDQLVSMVAFSIHAGQVEESKRFLKRADEAMRRAFEAEAGTSALEVERLRVRAAFRSFQNGLEVALGQIQNVELKSRAVRSSIFTGQAVHDLIAAAELSDDPELLGTTALAAFFANETLAGWAPPGEGGAEFYARRTTNRLQGMADEGGERAAEAAEFLGAIQLQVLRDARGAERSFRAALKLEPGRVRSWELLVLAGVQQGNEEFLEVAEERAAKHPHPRSSILQVKSYERSGDTMRAAWIALTAAETYPNDALVHLTLAATLLKEENAEMFLWRVEEALKRAEKGLGASANRQARVDLVLIKSIFLAMSDRNDEAKQLLETVRPLTPELQDVMRMIER
ncbi:MAG TPA: tetratricopeptide repeat protein [Verrucomicrobiae bacterium]